MRSSAVVLTWLALLGAWLWLLLLLPLRMLLLLLFPSGLDLDLAAEAKTAFLFIASRNWRKLHLKKLYFFPS